MSLGCPAPGLRDRKRAQTRARIEAAAVELVLRDGLEAATVDAISERAEVSPRTFFNYFESKDAAILGIGPEERDASVLDEQLAAIDAPDAVTALIRVVMTTMGAGEHADSDLHRRRVQIMRQYPQIIGTQFAQLNARKSRMVGYAARILAQDPRFHDDPEAAARPGIVLALCASAVRSAVEEWAHTTATGRRPGETDRADEAGETVRADENTAIEQRAVALVHSTLRRLA